MQNFGRFWPRTHSCDGQIKMHGQQFFDPWHAGQRFYVGLVPQSSHSATSELRPVGSLPPIDAKVSGLSNGGASP